MPYLDSETLRNLIESKMLTNWGSKETIFKKIDVDDDGVPTITDELITNYEIVGEGFTKESNDTIKAMISALAKSTAEAVIELIASEGIKVAKISAE